MSRNNSHLKQALHYLHVFRNSRLKTLKLRIFRIMSMLIILLKNYSQFSFKTKDGFLLKTFPMATRLLFLYSYKFEERVLAHFLILKSSGLFFTTSNKEAAFLRSLLALIVYNGLNSLGCEYGTPTFYLTDIFNHKTLRNCRGWIWCSNKRTKTYTQFTIYNQILLFINQIFTYTHFIFSYMFHIWGFTFTEKGQEIKTGSKV